MRRAARIDANQTDIVQALLGAGYSVQSLAGVGCGCPDLLVGAMGTNVLLEIKNPETTRGQTRETLEAQKKFSAFWQGQLAVVTTIEEAFEALRLACS